MLIDIARSYLNDIKIRIAGIDIIMNAIGLTKLMLKLLFLHCHFVNESVAVV